MIELLNILSNLNFYNMRRILSYLVLLMLFATSGYASIPLTTATVQWTGGGSPQHVLFKSTDTAYGLQTPSATQYADLSGYSKLVVTVSEGSPRAFFNATGPGEDQRLTNPHMTKNGNTFTYDLEAIVAENDFAHLNSIKAAASWVELTVTSIQLVEKANNAKTWDFTNWSTSLNNGWTQNGTRYTATTFADVHNNNMELITNGNTVIPETAGLKFNVNHSNQDSRFYIETASGNGGVVSELTAEIVITVPNLKNGDLLSVTGIQPNGYHSNSKFSISIGSETLHSSNRGTFGQSGNTITVEIPSTYTTPTDVVIRFNGATGTGGAFPTKIQKIEVKKSSIYFSDLKIAGENDEGANPYKDDFRNNVLSVAYSDIGKTTQFNFQLKDANGTVINDNTITPSAFQITSTDNTVVNVNSATISGPNSNGKYTISGITLEKQGTAYITITYGGITETHPINIKKKPVYIRAGGGAAFTKNLGDADWQILFHLCEEGSTTAIALDNTNYYSTSGFKNNTANDANGVVQNTATNLYNNSLQKWFSAKHIGSDVLVIRFRNHPLYEDCDAEFAFTVLKSKQDISYPQEFQDWTITYNEAEGYNLRTEVNNLLNTDLSNPTTHTNITVNNGIWTYTPSGKQITFKSSDTNVLTVNANTGKIQWTGNAGTATITATVAGDDTWASAEASFTVTINGDNAGPRLIWLTVYNTNTDNNNNQARGARYGYNWFKTGTDGDGKSVTNEKNNIIPYNDDAWFQAIALEPGTTNAQLLAKGLQYYPYKTDGGDDYFYYIETRENNPGGWRYNEAPIAEFLYNGDYNESGKIVYTVDVETSLAGTFWSTKDFYDKDKNKLTTESPDKGISVYVQAQAGQIGFGSRLHIGSTYGDSITVTATYPGVGRTNPGVVNTKTWVNSKDFGFSFQPEEGVVNKDHWIIPYVKFPNLQLVDFEKVWVTIDNEIAVTVDGGDDMFSLSKVINPSTSQPYATMDAAIDAIRACNSETELRRMLGGYFDYFKLTHDETLGWMIEGIYPKIWGLTVGEEADVTIHIVGATYNETKKFTNAEATYHVTVVDVTDDLFHWEMNDNAEGKDDKNVKKITMIEGDYIYMPGIIGNPNGNDDYSKEGSYKYLYSIQEGDIIMNYKPYFWREGVPNYFFTYNKVNDTESFSGTKPSGDRLIPTSHTYKGDAPEALIFWASGLGNYYRNDSLLIYANKPTSANQHLYLWAEDPQTGHCCTPIEIQIVPRSTLVSKRNEVLEHMTYPFTWDFEHMSVSDYELIKIDSRNGNYTDGNGRPYSGNGGSYWRKRWDSGGNSVLRTKHDVNKDYYQYNGVFNADYDDKDDNYTQGQGYDEEFNMKITGSRQRWFKDLSANGKYLNLFKGLRLNIAGLDYWQQKYTRFNVSTKPYGGIFFEGGVHYLSLPGFGINGSAVIFDATREKCSLPMPGSQVHFNTEENNCTPDYFNRGDAGGSGNEYYTHNNIFERYPETSNINDIKKKNHRVYFVIKAKGNSNRSMIFVGGKSMMMETNTDSYQTGIGTGTGIGENGTLYSSPSIDDTQWQQNNLAGNPTNVQRIVLTTNTKIYAIPLDPWDDDFQEQIYLAFNNGVHVYWMGITTEPRYLRDDYETYTYSYPVDLDIDRTNQLMGMLTEEKFGANNKVNMVPYYGTGYVHADKSLVVSRLLSDVKEIRGEGDLAEEELVNYKIPANEGIILYPTKRLHAIKKAIGDAAYEAGTEEGTVPGKTVIRVKSDGSGNPMTDANGRILYETTQYDYKYRYLPTYFIANAQNMDKDAYTADAGGRGKGTTINDANNALNDNNPNKIPAITTRSFVYSDGMERTNVPSYNMPNRLTASSYSTYIFRDYYSTDGQMPTGNNNGSANSTDGRYKHFIALGMTNEYNKKYLDYNEDYDVYKELKDYMHDVNGNQLTPNPDVLDNPITTPNDPTQGEFDEVTTYQYYYDMIGPGVVKFYRAGNDNWARGRRSYMKLTWQEYEVNTEGKIIFSADEASPGNEWSSSAGSGPGPNDPGSTAMGVRNNFTGIRVIFKNANGTNAEEETLVSEDGGFPDGINEVNDQPVDNNVFYNLNGVRVTTPVKGVYIHNGKKVIIK